MSFLESLGDFNLDYLKRFGISITAAAMAAPAMNNAPGTMDQASAQWNTIVRGAQYGLKEAGAFITKIDGVITPKGPTEKALVKASGTNWRMKPWFKIYQDIIAAQKSGKFHVSGATSRDPAPPPPTDDIGEPGGFGLSTTNTLLLVGLVGALVFLRKKKK